MRKAQGREEEAKALAAKAKDRIILFVAAEHLVGPLHTVNNQCNENAKTLTFDFPLPELDHHLLEGIKYPATNKDTVLIVFIDSQSYDPRNRKRLQLTREVAEKNHIPTLVHEVNKGTRLEEGLALIQFGAFANYHLAQGYGQDPAPIPFVDYFKEQMAKPEAKEPPEDQAHDNQRRSSPKKPTWWTNHGVTKNGSPSQKNTCSKSCSSNKDAASAFNTTKRTKRASTSSPGKSASHLAARKCRPTRNFALHAPGRRSTSPPNQSIAQKRLKTAQSSSPGHHNSSTHPTQRRLRPRRHEQTIISTQQQTTTPEII